MWVAAKCCVPYIMLNFFEGKEGEIRKYSQRYLHIPGSPEHFHKEIYHWGECTLYMLHRLAVNEVFGKPHVLEILIFLILSNTLSN